MALKLTAHRLNHEAELRQALNAFRTLPSLWLECDVRTTADGVLMARHDAVWRGRRMDSLRRAELPPKVLTLAEVLSLAKPSGLTLHLDVKADRRMGRWHAAARAESLLAELKRERMLDRVVVSGPAGQFLRRLRRLAPSLRLGVLCDAAYGQPRPRTRSDLERWLCRLLDFHRTVRLEAVFLNQAWLRIFDRRWRLLQDLFSRFRAAGIKPMVWTVNNPGWGRRLLSLGANRLTTDQPVRLWKALSDR